MDIVRAYAAGAVLPALLMPFILLWFSFAGFQDVATMPFFHFIPFMWGVWNVLFNTVLKDSIPGGRATRLFVTGAILGFRLGMG